MIDFASIFEETLNDEPFDANPREDRLKREDKDLFEGKRLHEVKASLSQDTKHRDYNSKTYRATMKGPGGKEEAIGVIFSGQRLEDLEQGALMADMETERRANGEKGLFDAPSRDVDLIGAWKPRSWKDGQGNQHKAFDLVVAAWSYTNTAGEKVMEGSTPTVAAATREEERAAAIASKAQARVDAKSQRRATDLGEIDF